MATAAVVSVAGALAKPALDALVEKAKDAYYCKDRCKELARTLKRKDLERMASTLLEISCSSAEHPRNDGNDAWSTLQQLCGLVDEAQYVVLACGAKSRCHHVWFGGRVKAVSDALNKFVDDKHVQVASWGDTLKAHRETSVGVRELQSNMHLRPSKSVKAKPVRSLGSTEDTPFRNITERVFQHHETLIPTIAAKVEKKERRCLAICGMAGIGKTTIAQAVYDRVKNSFSKAIFLTVGQQPDCKNLLEKAWVDVAPNRRVPFSNAAEGVQLLAERLREQTVLLVLDDVWNSQHIEDLNFATKLGMCHEDSCLVVTTRNRHVVRDDREAEVVEVPLLDDEPSRELFCWHAFRPQGEVPDGFDRKLVDDALAQCKNLPLMLQVGVHCVQQQQQQQQQQ
jgi:hypothetical protein